MPIISPPPLPVERFEEFRRFALTLDPKGWENAARIALSVQHSLGIAVVGSDAEEAEEEALRLWAADFGTERCRDNSERAQRAAEQPLPYAFNFAFGLPLQGWGEAAWTVPPGKILELNSWLRWALWLFYGAHGQTPDPVPPASTQSAAIEPTQPASTARRVHHSPVLDRVVAAMRNDIAEGADGRQTLTVDVLSEMTEEALRAQYHASRERCRKARRIVLDERCR